LFAAVRISWSLGWPSSRPSPFKRHVREISICKRPPQLRADEEAFTEGSYEITNARREAGVGEMLVETATAFEEIEMKKHQTPKHQTPRSSKSQHQNRSPDGARLKFGACSVFFGVWCLVFGVFTASAVTARSRRKNPLKY